MASQRPPWFRLQSMRAAAPPLAQPRPPAPARPPAPPPALVRPAFPIRAPPPPSLPPTAPPSPPPPPPAPAAVPQTPVVTAPLSPPPTAPPSPPVPAAAPLRFPVATPPPTPPKPRSPVVPPPPQPSPPRSPPTAPPAPKSPTPAPSTPPRMSPVTKSTLTTSTNFAQPSSSSVPTSPQNKTQSPSLSKAAAAVETANGKAATPVSSPKYSQNSPAQSPKINHPPSPLKLPPAQINTSEGEREPKIEQKNVLVQENTEKPIKTHNLHNHGNASKGKREPPMREKGTSKKHSDSEELGMRVITIAGDNKGALMEITSSGHKKHSPFGTAYNLQKKSSGEEGKSDDKEKTDNAQSQPVTTFLNSNVQGVNNSIVFNSTCHHNDPGIHLTLVRKANGGLIRQG